MRHASLRSCRLRRRRDEDRITATSLRSQYPPLFISHKLRQFIGDLRTKFHGGDLLQSARSLDYLHLIAHAAVQLRKHIQGWPDLGNDHIGYRQDTFPRAERPYLNSSARSAQRAFQLQETRDSDKALASHASGTQQLPS